MVSTPTTRNRFAKMATGDATNTWGVKLNQEVFDLVDAALDGVSAITVSGAVTLTSTNYAADQARMRFLKLSGAGGFTVTLPGVEKWYWVRNACSAAVTFSSGGVTVSVPAGQTRAVLCDGTDCFLGDDGAAKSYVDATFLPLAGGTMTGNLVLSAAPSSNLHAASKLYVDQTAFGSVTALPGQSGSAGNYLQTDGTNASWQPIDVSNLGVTWNNVATTFTAVKMNVTDTASASGSLLIDLQVGGVSRFSVTKGGTIELGDASDTTLARVSAGVVSIEGKRIYTTAGLVDFSETQAADSVGTRGVTQNSQSAAYTLVAADAGKHILHPSADTTARTFTIPANSSVAYPVGTVITFINQDSAGVVTIAITTDTMRFAGTGTTGSRTLAANGIATCIKLTSTEWLISGTGLT